jgi:hypothetical protein
LHLGQRRVVGKSAVFELLSGSLKELVAVDTTCQTMKPRT